MSSLPFLESDSETSRICYTTNLPLKWENLEQDNRITTWANANLIMLRSFFHLDTLELTNELKDQNTPLEKTIERLEAKVDLTMQLVSMLVHHHSPLPTLHPVSLFADKLIWQDEQIPHPVGQKIILTIYISGKLPLPLVLPAQVANIKPLDNKTAEMTAHFIDIDESER